MASEVNVTVSLQITKDNLVYRTSLTGFSDDMSGTKGPTPGALTIPTGGKVVPLGELITPGYCWLCNVSSTNYVEYGIRDPDTNKFYPLGELLPGKPQLIYLSRNVLEEYGGTGTGTTSPGNQFFMKANTADCVVLVEAFER